MGGMLPAEPTKLFDFQTTGHYFLIFGRGIIFPLTISASQMNNISHLLSNFPLGNREATRLHFRIPQIPKISAKIEKPTIGFEPMASSLPRKCSTPELRGQDFFICPPPHKQKLERETGLEPATLSLEG